MPKQFQALVADVPPSSSADKPREYRVDFAESGSARFTKAYELAKTYPSYKNFEENGKSWHSVTFEGNSEVELCRLAEVVRSLYTKRLYLNGTEVDWKEWLGWTKCFTKSLTEYSPFAYCCGVGDEAANVIGCRLLKLGVWNISTWGCYGKFMSKDNLRKVRGRLVVENQWEFDKQRLAFEVTKNLQRSALCPRLNTTLVDEVVNKFPKEVFVGPGRDWDFLITSMADLRDTGVQHYWVTSNGNFGKLDRGTIIGVRPTNLNFFGKILHSVFARKPTLLATVEMKQIPYSS